MPLLWPARANPATQTVLDMPILGINMPNMGTSEKSHTNPISDPVSLGDALFSSTQQRVMALLFGQPLRSFFANELILLTGSGSGAVQRELKRLAESGLVTSKWVGNQRHYQANSGSPIYSELTGIVQKTFGMTYPIRRALEPLSGDIQCAFIFGSVAGRRDVATSDIDLLVISERLTNADLVPVLVPIEEHLGRQINSTIYSPAEFAQKRAQKNAFLTRVLGHEKVWIIGSDSDL
jgi:predicted nucleotidyltransferase